LITAVEFLALENAKPPTLAAPAPRPRTTPGNGAMVPLPIGNLAGWSRWLPRVFIIDPAFATVAALLNPGC
jgi:hypothetical protein